MTASTHDMNRIMQALDEAAAQLEAVEAHRTEPIAVVGLDCRFPGAEEGPVSFWRLLDDGVCSISDIPAERWDVEAFYSPEPDQPNRYYTKRGGFLSNVDLFDHKRFKISFREAQHMDPQHRLLLECSWNAIENAGLRPESLRGSSMGVFAATAVNEYAGLIAKAEAIDAYFGSGNAGYAAAGRLAFSFGVHGPCMMIDTACSSSLTALHAACLNLRARECDSALVAGVNLMLAPEATVALSQARMLSPEGLCKTFDQSADGYVRGEGCAALVLKRKSDVSQEEFVWGWIRGSAVNHDGPSSGFTVPNGRAQEALYRQALKNACLSANDVSYLEAHGTGTALGDPIEMQSIASVYGAGRSSGITVGSVKTNVGHLEAVAGLAGLVKTLLALRSRRVPAHLHLSTPNPHIPWASIPVSVNRESIAWPSVTGPRIAAVSSFGASGTNAHVIVEGTDDAMSARAPREPSRDFDRRRCWFEDKRKPGLVTLDLDACLDRLVNDRRFSDAEKQAIPRLLSALREQAPQPAAAAEDDSLYDISWRAQPRRAHEPLHKVTPAESIADAADFVESKRDDSELNAYLVGLSAIEDMTPLLSLDALVRSGLSFHSGRALSLDECASMTGAGVEKRRLLARLLDIASQSGAIERNGEHWMYVSSPDESTLAQKLNECRSRNPAVRPELELVTRCVEAIPRILHSEIDPLGLLFPEHGTKASHLYQDCLGAQIMNRTAALAASSFAKRQAPGRLLRILEIGAGTGGTTSAILPALDGAAFEYVYTDVSPAFFEDARRRFGSEENIRYQTLDIERKPSEQGFDEEAFDLIIAANVLHTTADISQALSHVRSLAAPGGELILFEGTLPTAWLDLIFGLTDGWWRFNDARKQAGHPLLSPSRWKEALSSVGFESAADLTPDPGWAGQLSGQSLICASCKPEQPDSSSSSEPILILSSDGTFEDELVECAGGWGDFDREIWPDEPDRLHEWFSSISFDRYQRIVFLVSLDERVDDGCSLPALESSCRRSVEPLLFGVQQALKRSGDAARIAFVTRNAAGDPVWQTHGGFVQALAWGMSQSFYHEHPECRPQCIDIGSLDACDAALALERELDYVDIEPQVAYRERKRYAPRLLAASSGIQNEEPVNIQPDGCYLITGGRGGIGLQTAQWLLDRGARSVALLGRNTPDENAQTRIDEWNSETHRVESLQCDASDEEQLAKALDGLRAQGKAIRGVFHAAGALDDALIDGQNWDRYRTVFAPKLLAAWNLHRLTRYDPIDCFVIFSTTTSIFGAPGQSNHAAANRALDSLAAYRRLKGLPAISINWGPWADVGEAARRGSQSRFESLGFIAMNPDVGIRRLERILQCNPIQMAAVSIDWNRLAPALMNHPLMSEMKQTSGAVSDKTRTEEQTDDWKRLTPARRKAFFVDALSGMVSDILGEGGIDPDQGFFDLGMDSLTAVELRNRIHRRFGVSLSSTAALNHPSVNRLADHLLEAIGVDDSPQSVAADSDEFEGMNEDELSGLLEQELDELEDRP